MPMKLSGHNIQAPLSIMMLLEDQIPEAMTGGDAASRVEGKAVIKAVQKLFPETRIWESSHHCYSRDPLTPCHIQSRAGPKQIRPTLAIPPERNIDGSAVSELEYLKEPANLVQGSATALFSVIDNILGTAMQYLQQLFQMPFGCREQNMVLFAPNIYVLDYLNKTGQLSKETKSKAIGYLASGYQKQLSYEHPDRSYSVFGSRDKEGRNTWLSAFVYKSLAQAKCYIYIVNKIYERCDSGEEEYMTSFHSQPTSPLLCSTLNIPA
ncbi:unnamed protein product, partial [Lepidochelys olivacea]